jgi:predicted nucleotidyltransferase
MDLQALRGSWERRWQAEAARAAEAREEAVAVLPALVSLLVEGYGATGVLLIGSLARDLGRPFGAPGAFRADSDLDLVVAGLSPADLWRAGAAVEALAGRDVDLIPWEDADEALRDTVADHGRLLHGAL